MAAVAAFFMSVAALAGSVPPPDDLRHAGYPCWRGSVLIDALLSDNMRPRNRGVLLRKIDPQTPVIEFWSNDKSFAVLAVYPRRKFVCAVLVGDVVDGDRHHAV